MSHITIPHFQNNIGIEAIRIGSRAFKCMGALPPFDHPHIFLDMGYDADVMCPYCSTRFVYDSSLKAQEADPSVAAFLEEAL